MMFDPSRHEPLAPDTWDTEAARLMIRQIAAGTEEDFLPGGGWRTHPHDAADPAPEQGLYIGSAGIIWALRALHARGVTDPPADYSAHLESLGGSPTHPAAYLFGQTPLLLLRHQTSREPALADALAALIEANLHHPARELMWGSPGTMLAALFLYRRTAEPRFADLFRRTASVLASQLLWSEEHLCHYWDQDLYGHNSTYLDAVHGFVATASVLIQGRELLGDDAWPEWQRRIHRTIRATAERDGALANWRAHLRSPAGGRKLVQFCHGAPGFVICLADDPSDALDDLLLAGGECTWQAGPLRKGSNLCHGTGGNGYAFLKLYQRTGDEEWLHRARAFAMHGIAQTRAAHAEFGQWRHGLWTGDLGFACFLADCIEAKDRFPTLDTFEA